MTFCSDASQSYPPLATIKLNWKKSCKLIGEKRDSLTGDVTTWARDTRDG